MGIIQMTLSFHSRGEYHFVSIWKASQTHAWGLKAYILSDSKTGYMHNLRIYYGKDTKLIDNHEASHTVKVVTNLTDHLRYDLYTDRFYTSPLLADALE